MKIVQRLICCGVLMSLPLLSYAQLTTANLYATQDSHTRSNLSSANTNYGNNTTMLTQRQYFNSGGPRGFISQSYRRSFVQFNLSSIPSNAIIYSAELRLVTNGNVSGLGSFLWNTKLITSSWSESTITHNNQPGISTLSSDLVSTTPVLNGTQAIDVTDMVQRMVYGAADNYGWCIQVDNESISMQTGGSFYTSEYSSQFSRPQLYIQYYLPVTFSNVLVTHESATGASDGGVSLDHTGVGSTSHTYKWINSSGTQVATTKNLSGVSYGWYGLEITGTSTGEKAYFGFLIGTECEEVTITYDSRPEYTHNVYVWDHVTTSGVDYRDWNWSNMFYFRTDNKNTSPQWSDIKSYIDFNTWMDDAFQINQADILFEGWTHIGNGSSNPAEFNEVTSSWHEDVITWNSLPTNNPTAGATVPSTTSSTSDMTVDMIALWNDWKQDNNTNYGSVFQLQAFDDDYDTRHVYHSPNTSTTSLRPEWTFRLQLGEPNNPILCGTGLDSYPYHELRKTLDGGYGESYEDNLNFVIDEAYGIDAGSYLHATIYNDDHEAIATSDAAGATSGGIPALTYVFDDNRYSMSLSGITTMVNGQFYVLEVKNTKGDRFYLKFKHND